MSAIEADANATTRLKAVLDTFGKILATYLDADSLKPLVDEFIASWHVFRHVQPVRDLLIFRKSWLENVVEDELEFSWSMPNAQLGDHPSLEAFLRSELKSMNFRGHFDSFKDLLEFCRKCERASGLASGFTVRMEPQGIKPNSCIHVVKTTEYYEKKVANNAMYKKELSVIIDALK